MHQYSSYGLQISLYFISFSVFFFTILQVTASRIDSQYHADHLDRLEVDRMQIVGPPNPPAECVPFFGHPYHCSSLLWNLVHGSYLDHLAVRESNGEAGVYDLMIGPLPLQAALASEWAVEVIQYLGPGASSSVGNDLRTYKLPKTWPDNEFGFPGRSNPSPEEESCQITLMTHTDPGVDNKDNATIVDYNAVTKNVISSCLSGTGDNHGGYQIYGETNKLAVFVYHPRSEFSDAIDIVHGCVRRGWVKILEMMRRLGIFNRSCEAAEEEAAWAGGSGDSGTSEIERHCKRGSLRLADVLYGLDTAAKWVVDNCQGYVAVELSTVGKFQ